MAAAICHRRETATREQAEKEIKVVKETGHSEQSLQHLANMDWPWKSEDPVIHIILTSDEQFLKMAEHPDEPVARMFPGAPSPISLREHCRRGAAIGARKLLIAYDYFFGGSKRALYPDTPQFQQALKKICDVAQEFGLGLEPSIISPLELGTGYRTTTGKAGRWMHYREGLRDPQTGAYSLTMWQHQQWCNNKGPTPVKTIGVRAFAFREERIPDTRFFAVPPESIVELEPPHIEKEPGYTFTNGKAMFRARRVRVWGRGGPPGFDRVLVVLLYETVEMDYGDPSAATFLDDLTRRYHEQGISLAGIYADEMHIQQDWSYHSHLEHGQFAMRYVSPGLERAFAACYGSRYADLAPYMLYFACHQHDFALSHEPKLPCQHVFGSTQEEILATLRFRRDYYHFLENTVVKLMIAARDRLEQLGEHELDIFYHATWAESPTCDVWAVGGVPKSWSPEEHRRRYEYTPDFVWSNTIQQAAAACANYFLWNEFLTGGNDDTAEGGYADRNYYGRALACSLAALNRRPLASAGMWGMPAPVRERMEAVSAVFGAGGHPIFRSVADYAPRKIEVLFLYPQDLVAVEERFGSWMTQYGYANYITAEKLVEYGRVTDNGELAVKSSRYRALCVLYEPFPNDGLLTLLRNFLDRGGTVIWSGIPPMEVRKEWEKLFGVRIEPTSDPLGMALPARQVTFAGALEGIEPMSILTDFVVDRVFPLHPQSGAEVVASLRAGGASPPLCVGVRRPYPGGGQAVCLGFRPRDDQSASTGNDVSTWFDILHKLGAYPGDDNPTVLSRKGNYLACAFPNGALALCPHYRHHEESWPGSFFRDPDLDRRLLEANPPPDDAIVLKGFKIAGQIVSYRGRHAVAWRYDGNGNLLAFAGLNCTGITLGDHRLTWSDSPVDIAWHKLYPEQRTLNCRPLYRVWCGTPGRMQVPLDLTPGDIQVWAGAHCPLAARRATRGRVGYGEEQVTFSVHDGDLILDISDDLRERWLYVVQP